MKTYSNEYVSDEYGLPITRKKLVKRLVRRDSNHLGLALLCFFAVSVTSDLLLGLLFNSSYFTSINFHLGVDGYYLLNGTLSFLSLCLPFLIYLSIKKESLGDILQFKPVKFVHALMYIIMGWGLCLSANIPVNVLYSFMDDAGIQSGVITQPNSNSLLSFALKIIAVGVVPAIFEEFVFRGVILTKLTKYGTAFALVVSSVLFSMLHSSLVGIPFAFLAGLVIGFIYIKTGNLWIAIAIHFLNNTFSVFQEELVLYFDANTVQNIFGVLFYLAVILSFVFFAIFEYKHKISQNLTNDIPFVKFKSKVFAFLTNPSIIVFFAICIWSLVKNMMYYG